jgi:hypothetical protein
MKQYYLLALSVFLLTGCYKEKAITPTHLESITDKFAFPQGNTTADAAFKRIYDKYGIKPIYKDFTKKDIERTWLPTTSNPIFTVNYKWSYLSGSRLDTVASILENKVFSLLPDTIMKVVARAFPYMYLIDSFYEASNPAAFYPKYPENALDGITVNLQSIANSNNYSYKVFFPAYVASIFFEYAFNSGIMTLPNSFYDDLDASRWIYQTSYNNANTVNDITGLKDRYNDYYARMGILPMIQSAFTMGWLRTGRHSAGGTGNRPVNYTKNWEVKFFFLFLSVDVNWKTYFQPGNIYEDCPRLERRVWAFYNKMKEYGIDFDAIQKKLYAGTTVNTDPNRMWARLVNTDDQRTYIYYEQNDN